MRKKSLLSFLVALSLIVASFGVTVLADSNGKFRTTSDGIFTWNFYDNDGTLTTAKTTDSIVFYPSNWDNLASKVENMTICGTSESPKKDYNYSYFKDGMSKLKKISVNDNCKNLTIKNYCPSLETIEYWNNAANSVSIDFSGRNTASFPNIKINSSTFNNLYLNFSKYAGSSSITVPYGYGKDSLITYSFKESNLTTVNFASGTKIIPEDAFYKCTLLSKVTIPDGVTTIEYNAFRKCSKLESITIPSSVTSIGMNAFKDSGIKTIDFLGTRAKWNSLVKEYEDDKLVGETLHLDGATVRCSDGDIAIHYNKSTSKYYQTNIGWQNKNGSLYYYYANGSYAKGITVIDSKQYYFDSKGIMQKGWVQVESAWYFADRSTGVLKQTGWLQDGGSWYFFNRYNMTTGWKTINSIKYYFDKTSGKMTTGWKEIDSNWYLFNNSGAMQTGWKQVNGKWYYLNPSDGIMVTGWIQISGKWYFLKSNGAMAASEWCEGYWLNADGTWTYPHKATWRMTNGKWWFGDDSGWYAKNETLMINGVSYKFDAKGYMV